MHIQRNAHLIFVFVAAIGFASTSYGQSRRAPAPAPMVEEAPAPAPAPAPAAPVAPAPAASPVGQDLWTSASIDGAYKGACGRIQVRGDNQFISYQRELSIAGAGTRFQTTDYFFRSPDCTGSLYAAYQFPQRTTQAVGRRTVALPESGQPVQGILLIQPSSTGQVQYVGAVIPVPNSPDSIGIAANGALVAPIALNQRQDEDRLLLHPSREGLHMVSHREAGAASDSQGMPTRFVRPMAMVRVR